MQESGHADGDDPHGDDTVIHAEEDYVRPRYHLGSLINTLLFCSCCYDNTQQLCCCVAATTASPASPRVELRHRHSFVRDDSLSDKVTVRRPLMNVLPHTHASCLMLTTYPA